MEQDSKLIKKNRQLGFEIQQIKQQDPDYETNPDYIEKRNTLVENNLGYCHYLAEHFYQGFQTLQERIAEAYLLLVNVANHWNPAREANLGTYLKQTYINFFNRESKKKRGKQMSTKKEKYIPDKSKTPEEEVEQTDLKNYLRKLITQILSPRETRVITSYKEFGGSKTLAQIAEKEYCDPSSIQRTKDNILRKLQEALQSRNHSLESLI